MSDAQLLAQLASARRHVLRTAGLHNGWASGSMTGAEAVTIYKREITRSDEVLAKIDLDAPPRWWPPASVFDAPPMSNGREVLFRVLAETSVHAGHLDIVRELIARLRSISAHSQAAYSSFVFCGLPRQRPSSTH